MRKLLVLLLFITNIAYCQISTNNKIKQLPNNDFNLKNKNEIILQETLPVFRPRLYYNTIYGETFGAGIDSLGKFKISTTQPFYPYIFPNNGSYLVWIELYPGEEIQLSQSKTGNFIFSSKNTVRAAELSFYDENLLFSTKYDYNFPRKENKTWAQILVHADSIELARNVYLKEFTSRNKVSDHFISVITKLIETKKNLFLARSLVTQTEINPEKLLPVIEKLKEFYCSNDTLLTMDRYSGAIAYCQYLTTQEMKLKDTPENKFTTAIKYFKGKTLDIMLFVFTKEALRTNSLAKLDILNEFYSRCKDPDCIEKIKMQEAKNNLATDKTIVDGLLMLDKSKSTWAQLLTKYKGKVIYVDFWASWCGPCIAEIPSLEKLKGLYANKGVVFISISTDEQFSDWKSKVEQLKIANPFSYLLASGASSQLMKSLEIKTIPRFVLIDKSGKIVERDAIRPSDKGINALIDKYL